MHWIFLKDSVETMHVIIVKIVILVRLIVELVQKHAEMVLVAQARVVGLVPRIVAHVQ